jgi:tetratricopeptide (TPR) repeat protein/DNA-binding PadR family transcriptional regulator
VPRVSYLSSEILEYVASHGPAEESAYGIGQRELAKSLGYHACSMSRPLAALVRDGYLRVRRGPVRGGSRRQLVYSITEAGRDHLAKQSQDVPIVSGALPPPPTPFVGRKGELQQLRTASASGGAVVLVEGAAGIGKTALVSRYVRRLSAGTVTFWFTIRAASSPRHFVMTLAHALSSLESGALASYSELPREPSGREAADLVARAVGDRAFVGVLDDWDSASSDLQAFLRDFGQGLLRRRAHVLFALGHSIADWPLDGVPTHRVAVGGLDRAAAYELTQRRGGLGERFEGVFRSTGGSPLLLQLAVASGDSDIAPEALPAEMAARLSSAEIVSLAPLALAAEPLPVVALPELGGPSADRVQDWTRDGLVQHAAEGRVEISPSIKSDLQGRIPVAVERRARLKLARFYGRSRRPESVRERFLHLVAAHAWREASDLLDEQERALFSLGYSDPLRDAIRQLSVSVPSNTGRVRALQAEAELLRLHSQYADSLVALRRALAEAYGDRRTEAECWLASVEAHVRLQQIPEAERALAEAQNRGPFSRRTSISLLLAEGRVLEARGELPRARDVFHRAFETADRIDETELALEGLSRWSRLVSLEGDRESALRVIEQGLPRARAAGRTDLALTLILTRARAFSEVGQVERAENELRSVRREAESLGQLGAVTYALSGLAGLLLQSDDPARREEGIADARQGSELAERMRNDVVLGHTLAMMCAGERKQGRLEEARRHGERAVAVLERLAPTDSLILARGYLAEAYVELGQPERARVEFDAASKLAEEMGMVWWRERLAAEIGPRLNGAVPREARAEASA